MQGFRATHRGERGMTWRSWKGRILISRSLSLFYHLPVPCLQECVSNLLLRGTYLTTQYCCTPAVCLGLTKATTAVQSEQREDQCLPPAQIFDLLPGPVWHPPLNSVLTFPVLDWAYWETAWVCLSHIAGPAPGAAAWLQRKNCGQKKKKKKVWNKVTTVATSFQPLTTLLSPRLQGFACELKDPCDCNPLPKKCSTWERGSAKFGCQPLPPCSPSADIQAVQRQLGWCYLCQASRKRQFPIWKTHSFSEH